MSENENETNNLKWFDLNSIFHSIFIVQSEADTIFQVKVGKFVSFLFLK